MKIFNFPTVMQLKQAKFIKQNIKQANKQTMKAKEKFPRFPSFRFSLQAQIENLETSEIFSFLLNLILKLHSSSLKSFFWFLDFELFNYQKIEVKENFLRFPSFGFQL